MAKPLNVAAPLASVVAVALLNVAPAGPEAITAVTGTPAPPAGVPAPSRTWSTRCGVDAAPLAAAREGSVVIVRWGAAPSPRVVVEGAAGVGPAAWDRNEEPAAAAVERRPAERRRPARHRRRGGVAQRRAGWAGGNHRGHRHARPTGGVARPIPHLERRLRVERGPTRRRRRGLGRDRELGRGPRPECDRGGCGWDRKSVVEGKSVDL